LSEGFGFVKMAKTFNAEQLVPPRDTWSSSAIHAMVFNEMYRGVIVYGKTRWEDRGDDKVKVRVPLEEWVRVEKPELRIILEDLWQAAHERLAHTRAAYLRHTNGRVWGRPETGKPSPYLLTGLSVCGCCGSSLFVRKRPDRRDPSRTPYAYYACSYYHLRGERVCANRLTMPLTAADDAVLRVLKQDILNPAALALAIETTIE